MAKLLATIKAIITRLIFSAHGFIAIWQVTQYKKDPVYWYLSTPIIILFFEGIFTLAIKKSQEWRWFCPSVFFYLSSVVPAIWLLELDKMNRRNKIKEETFNFAAVGADLNNMNNLLGVKIQLPDIQMNAETWVTLIEQFLMLVLIIGRWMLPKGDLTRDQLSQLLLVYIGTAADIIEFFDSFKDNKIASEPVLVFLTLSIWSWSLLQFTIVLSATRSRKPRGGGTSADKEDDTICCTGCCCGIDAWGIALNIILQDAPFLIFRLLIIIHYQIISYMNVFFTCKNTLVIMLQLYRLYVVHSENAKNAKKLRKPIRNRNYRNADSQRRHRKSRKGDEEELSEIYVISDSYERKNTKRIKESVDDSDAEEYEKTKKGSRKHKTTARKDTGYSTADSSDGERQKKKRQSKGSEKRKSRKCDTDSDDDGKSKNEKKSEKMKKSKKTISSSEYEEVCEKSSRKGKHRKAASSESE